MKKILFAFFACALALSACVEDEQFAGITSVSQNPTTVGIDDPVTITATTMGMSSLTLKYKVGSAAVQSVSMTGSNGTFTGIIPGQAEDASVTYWVEGEGNNGTVKSAEASYVVGFVPPPIFINECDPAAKKWEIYNAGTETVDLSGMVMYKDDDMARPYYFPEGTTLAAGEFLVLTRNESGSPTFGMSADGGFKYDIYDADNNLIETFDNLTSITVLGSGESIGRKPDGSANIVVFTQITIGSSNNDATVKQ